MKRSARIEAIFQQCNELLGAEEAREFGCRLTNALVDAVAFQVREQLALARGMESSDLQQASIHQQLATVSMDIVRKIPSLARNELILAMRSRDEVLVANLVAELL